MVMGESGSGKTYTLAGEGTSRAGIVSMIFDTLFSRLNGGIFLQSYFTISTLIQPLFFWFFV